VHRQVDDRPFGGGRHAAHAWPGRGLRRGGAAAGRIAARASGHAHAGRAASGSGDRRGTGDTRTGSCSVCGRYEGFDERIKAILQPDEISIGDYVLSGGEVAAMVIVDAVTRLLPGVLGDEEKPPARIPSPGRNASWKARNTPGRASIAACARARRAAFGRPSADRGMAA